MKSVCKGMVALGFVGGVAASEAIVLNFDDVATSTFVSLPSNYQGFTWSSTASVVDNGLYNTTYSNTITFPSGSKALYNEIADTGLVTVTNNVSFTFDGLSAAFWATNDASGVYSSSTLTVKGYLNNVFVGSSSMNLGAQFATMNGFAGAVDRLEFINDDVNLPNLYWLVDDLRLGTPGTVPEPMTMGLGLAAVAAYARRRTKSA